MTTLDKDRLAREALDIIPWQARRFPKLPPGVSADDLESAGHEGLVNAIHTFDPDGAAGWRTYARACIKNAMRNAIRDARAGVRGRSVPLEVRTADGEEFPRVDRRATDPADVAAARELILAPGPRRVRDLAAGLPTPAEVADRVVALRAAMFGAISEQDVGDVMQTVVGKAKAGDLRAAKLITDLLAPGRSGVTVQQQAVVIHQGDIG